MLTFAEIQIEDIEEICALEERTFSMPWKAADFMDMIRLPYCYYIAAREDGRLVGCCGVRDMCGDGEITNVVIDESCRGRGYGERMLRYLMQEALRRGVISFTLEVRQSNAPARGLYEKLGFVSEGIRPDFYEAPKEDAIIYWLRDAGRN